MVLPPVTKIGIKIWVLPTRELMICARHCSASKKRMMSCSLRMVLLDGTINKFCTFLKHGYRVMLASWEIFCTDLDPVRQHCATKIYSIERIRIYSCRSYGFAKYIVASWVARRLFKQPAVLDNATCRVNKFGIILEKLKGVD